ncbi:GntR family transcriptional regulator [Acuticoccus sp. MNP-M23]|uniref:GntR family transcriptional regulator n=1 Tax=Acuticoccus sp. MNP-M23 TaxID=3072793 RepID=UPI002815CEAA|nr:GntR family transcriptional regulator [Acuticoccus sp. MNP-M23]WMS42606.1 GntR family transcriptional regulator [Acuticoccus sp. MNP-M23]
MDENAQDSTQPLLMRLDPAARVSLRDHVRQALRMAIIAGQFAPDTRLNERALAEALGVSTTPLKEALRQLEAEGLIEVEPRKGLVVRFDKAFAQEMILARAALEAPIAALCAERIDPEGRTGLGATVRLMGEATDAMDVERLIVLNEAFHGEIHRISGSRHLVRMVAQQQFYDDTARRVIHRQAADSARALEEHRTICEAIVAGDAAGAADAMHSHVRRSGDLYMNSVFTPKGADLACD